MQVDPMKPKLKPPGVEHLKPKCGMPLSHYAFKFNLRRYIQEFVEELCRVFGAAYHHLVPRAAPP